MTKPTVLVLGYGNPGRCDDGLGPALADRLRRERIPGVRVESCYQLSVEDAATAADHQVVIFADASVRGDAPFEIRPLEPCTDTAQFTSHALGPAGVLGLARELFGADTAGWALAIRGARFDDFDEELSSEARTNLEAAVVFLERALASSWPIEKAHPRTSRTTWK